MSILDRLGVQLGKTHGVLTSATAITVDYAYGGGHDFRRLDDARHLVARVAPAIRVLEEMILLAEKAEASGDDPISTADTQAKILAMLERLVSSNEGPKILATLERIDWALRNRAEGTPR